MAPSGVDNTRWNTQQRQPCLRGNYRQFLGLLFLDVNGIQTEGSERSGVEAPQRCLCPAACASTWRQPSLFSDDTHAAVTWPKWALEHGIHTEWSHMLRAWPISWCRTRKRAEVNGRWILLLDVAPVHVSASFVKAVKPRCVLCYTRPGTTSMCQPAEIA